MLIAASDIAKKPKMLDVLNMLSEFPANPAIIAPTIITDDIALVTDIKGVCSDGVKMRCFSQKKSLAHPRQKCLFCRTGFANRNTEKLLNN